MSASDPKIVSERAQREEETRREIEAREENKIEDPEVMQDEKLRGLVASNKMYDAMENFLLGDPRRQIPELGMPEFLIQKANEEKSKGDRLTARANYETAAKIEIYNLDEENTKRCLELAGDVTDEGDRHRKLQETMLSNLDEVMKISKEYYGNITARGEMGA